MSLNLPAVLKVDPVLAISNYNKGVEIKRGPACLNFQKWNTNQVSNSGIKWNFQLPNQDTVVDKYMYASVPISVTITGTAPPAGANLGEYLMSNNFIAWRQFPLNSIINTASLMLNNQQISSQPYLFINPLSRFQNDFVERAQRQSATPVMPDQSPHYADLTASGHNPLLQYASATTVYSEPRGVFNAFFNTQNDSTTSWTFTTTLNEPIFIPALNYDPSDQEAGFPYINNMVLTLTFLSNLGRMFSIDNQGGHVTGIAVTIAGQAILSQQWDVIPTDFPQPEVNVRSYNDFNVVSSQQLNSVLPGAQSVMVSSAQVFTQVPSKIWIFVRESQIDYTNNCFDTDCYFSIQNLNVQWNSRAGLLANATPLDLYTNFEARMGSVMTYTQCQKYVGSVLCIDPVQAFNLANNETTGTPGNYQFQVTVTATNLKNYTITPSVYIAYAYDSTLVCRKDGVILIEQSIVSQDMVAANSPSRGIPMVPYGYSVSSLYGGSLWDKIKSGLSKAWNFVKDQKLVSKGLNLAARALPQYAPALTSAANVAEQFGVGAYQPRVLGGRATNKREMRQHVNRLYT